MWRMYIVCEGSGNSQMSFFLILKFSILLMYCDCLMISLLPPSVIASSTAFYLTGDSVMRSLPLFGKLAWWQPLLGCKRFRESTYGIVYLNFYDNINCSLRFPVYKAFMHGAGGHGKYFPMVVHVCFKPIHERLGHTVYQSYHLDCFLFFGPITFGACI